MLSSDNQPFCHTETTIHLALDCQLFLIGYYYVALIKSSIHLHLRPCFPGLASFNSVMIPLLVIMLNHLGNFNEYIIGI